MNNRIKCFLIISKHIFSVNNWSFDLEIQWNSVWAVVLDGVVTQTHANRRLNYTIPSVLNDIFLSNRKSSNSKCFTPKI